MKSRAWFASTVHKSQGSEYPLVILPLYMQHYMMLSRNLPYTGLTRAKQLAILVGSSKAKYNPVLSLWENPIAQRLSGL